MTDADVIRKTAHGHRSMAELCTHESESEMVFCLNTKATQLEQIADRLDRNAAVMAIVDEFMEKSVGPNDCVDYAVAESFCRKLIAARKAIK